VISSAIAWLRGRRYKEVRHPYPLSSFTDTDIDRSLFLGRVRETGKLLEKVLTSDLVLLIGRSGLGKTSLINAGIMKPLREQHYFPVVCQLIHNCEQSPPELIRSRVLEAARKFAVEAEGPDGSRSLWEFFYETTFRQGSQRLRPVLILDQFENLFSRIASEPGREQEWQQRLVDDLADLVRHRVPEHLKTSYLEALDKLPEEGDERRKLINLLYEGGGPDIKVLISIREDSLAELEALRSKIPAIFSNCIGLEPLTAEQAREAITVPAERAALVGMSPFKFEDRALDEMIAFLSLDRRTGKPRAGASIEPAQLQILCYELSVQRLKKGASIIRSLDLGGTGGMLRVMKRFYDRTLRRFPRVRFGWSTRAWRPSLTNFIVAHRPRKAISRLCEYGLITRTGYRNSLILDDIQRRFGVSETNLDKLVEFALLRSERRLGTVFYHLVADTLIEPLRRIRRNRTFLRAAVAIVLILLPAARGIFQAINEADALRLFHFGTTPEERQNGFRELIMTKERLDFSKKQLAGFNMNYMFIADARFVGADMSGTLMQNTYFIGADFSGASLQNVNATGAKFVNSYFEEAKVTGANVKDADFPGSDWWMAVGWTDEQVKDLQNRFAVKFYFSSPRYRQMVVSLAANILSAPSRTEARLAQNDLAWYRATHSNEEGELEAASNEIEAALSAGADAQMLGTSHRVKMLDTRGWIFLRRGEYARSIADFKEALTLASQSKLAEKEASDLLGTVGYHLALAYERAGSTKEAQDAFTDATKLGYEPSYERVLLARRLPQAPIRSAPSEYERLLQQ
jgi:tetratricopeptide (TPR) repeat protein